MRNPIRIKNAKARFWPAFAAGGVALLLAHPTLGAIAVGLPAVFLGVCIRSWGAGHLVKNDRLTLSGPYARVRHPLYLGTLFVGLGFACMLGGASAATSLAMIVPWFFWFYFPRKEQIESHRLSDRYGALYDCYHAQVAALWPARTAWSVPAHLSCADEQEDRRWSLSRYDENNELGTLIAIIAGVLVVSGLAVWRV